MNTILNHDIKTAYENYRSATNTEMKKLQDGYELFHHMLSGMKSVPVYSCVF
jgi:hypothetical protein